MCKLIGQLLECDWRAHYTHQQSPLHAPMGGLPAFEFSVSLSDIHSCTQFQRPDQPLWLATSKGIPDLLPIH